MVPKPLPFWEGVQVMLGQSFLNRFTPANSGGMALRVRYLQKRGVDIGGAAAGVGLTSAASGVSQVVVLVAFAAWAGAGSGAGVRFSLPDQDVFSINANATPPSQTGVWAHVALRMAGGAVLFVGLAIGAFAPKANISGPIGLTGLVMFLYGIGILYGRQFFEGMAGAEGRKYNFLALIAVFAGLAVALGLGHVYGIKIGHTLGMFAGSMTSTATLQAALEVMKNSDPSIGYSIAYPFGVIGPILCIYFMTRAVKPQFPAKAQRFHMGEITLSGAAAGRTLSQLSSELPKGVQMTMVRIKQDNVVPVDDLVLSAGDALLVVADSEEGLSQATARLGKLEPGRLVQERSSLDYIRVFVGKGSMVGVPLSKLAFPGGTQLLHVRRYDADIVPTPDLMLEFGDRVGAQESWPLRVRSRRSPSTVAIASALSAITALVRVPC